MTRVRTWSNAGQEHHALPAAPEPLRPHAAAIERLTRLLTRLADELDALPEAERDAVLGEAMLWANTMESER